MTLAQLDALADVHEATVDEKARKRRAARRRQTAVDPAVELAKLASLKAV
jgi:hypothetical protein